MVQLLFSTIEPSTIIVIDYDRLRPRDERSGDDKLYITFGELHGMLLLIRCLYFAIVDLFPETKRLYAIWRLTENSFSQF